MSSTEVMISPAVSQCMGNPDLVRYLIHFLPIHHLALCEAINHEWQVMIHERYMSLLKTKEEYRCMTYQCHFTDVIGRPSQCVEEIVVDGSSTAGSTVIENDQPMETESDEKEDNLVIRLMHRNGTPRVNYKTILANLYRLQRLADVPASSFSSPSAFSSFPSLPPSLSSSLNDEKEVERMETEAMVEKEKGAKSNLPPSSPAIDVTSPSVPPSQLAPSLPSIIPAGMLLYGSGFAISTSSYCMIRDSPTQTLQGHIQPVKDFYPGDTLTATASVYDINRRMIYSFGGWDEQSERTLKRVMKLSVNSIFTFNRDHNTLLSPYQTTSVPVQLTASISLANSYLAPIRPTPILPHWERVNETLPKKTCFPAATVTPWGDIAVLGGGSSPYRGAIVYNHCSIFCPNTETWWGNSNDIITPMNEVRCGHMALTLYPNATLSRDMPTVSPLMVLGGYGGGMTYYNTAEIYDWETKVWSFTSMPMKYSRSCPAAIVGPFGSVYVAGGSANGEIGQRSAERYDPREGKWEEIASMACRRGYTYGTLSPSMRFYVTGGQNEHKLQGGLEAYDFRMNKWEVIRNSTLCKEYMDENECTFHLNLL